MNEDVISWHDLPASSSLSSNNEDQVLNWMDVMDVMEGCAPVSFLFLRINFTFLTVEK